MDDVKLQLTHLLFSGDLENEGTYVETLAPILQKAVAASRTDEMVDLLTDIETQKESELSGHCDSCSGLFLESAKYLEQIQLGGDSISQCAHSVHSQITRTGNELVESKAKHQQLSNTTLNISTTLDTLRLCLKGLEYTNQVHSMLKQNNRIGAVQALNDLKSLALHNMRHLGLGKMITKAVPGLTTLILDSTRSQLDTFIDGLQKDDYNAGERAYGCLTKQRELWKKLQGRYPHLAAFRFNSHAERAYRESTTNYFDYERIGLELGSLHEAQLVYSKLGKQDDIVSHMHSLRLAQSKQLDGGSWDNLQTVAGFCVIERVISLELPDLRPPQLVDDMCDQLCQRYTQNLTKRLALINKLEELTPIRDALTQFMETLENFGFNVNSIASVLLELLKHLSKMLVQSSRTSFLDTWKQADHMPMVVNKEKLYDTIKSVVFSDLKPTPESFPKTLPFSEIYPLMCADLRSLISHHTSFFDQFQRDPVVVEETMVQAVDNYLTETVCKTMTSSLGIDNREKLVQTVIDLKYLIDAAVSVRSLLQQNRLSGRRGTLTLRAVPQFERAYKDVESKVFDFVNNSIDNFVSTADYDWEKSEAQGAQSPYALDMVAYLLTLANTVLARLPDDLRSFMYLSTVDHLNSALMKILVDAPLTVTPHALEDFVVDLEFIESTVAQLRPDASQKGELMISKLTEVREGVDLLRSPDPVAELKDNQVRMRKYSQISAENVQKLLQKTTTPVSSPKAQQPSKFLRYISGDKT